MKIKYKKQIIALTIAGIFFIAPSQPAHASGSEEMLGSISLFAGTYAPYGWAFCDGSILSVSQNCALYSLLGNSYGGRYPTTFALPDLRGRVPVHFGRGTGLNNNYVIGDAGGYETVTLTASQLQLQISTAAVDSSVLDNGTSQAWLVIANPASVTGAAYFVLGGSLPGDNMQPYLALNYIICISGNYPLRD